MRSLLITLPFVAAVAMSAHAADLAEAKSSAQPQEIVLQQNEQTGEIKVQGTDGSWQQVAGPAAETGLVHQAQYAYDPNYGYGGYGPGYGYGYGNGCNCAPQVTVLPAPLPPPAYYGPQYGPQIYYNGAYGYPRRAWYGGGYRYYGY